MSASSCTSVDCDHSTQSDILPSDDYVSLFSILAWDISRRPVVKNEMKNGIKHKQNKDEDRIEQVRLKTMEESVHLMSDMPQLYLLCNIASMTELDDISTLAGLDRPGWICSNSLIVSCRNLLVFYRLYFFCFQ
ncbi:hypothetical protein Tcan_07511 [Toxocara canis]|uniref:Uncharacterized protein n=1 Tax=Toxocara canis TaxID=6265 RepID=A0A0B2UUH9_TOXCA|nr:hypothetical protein Tcan_07511 [Toxocara canis]